MWRHETASEPPIGTLRPRTGLPVRWKNVGKAKGPSSSSGLGSMKKLILKCSLSSGDIVMLTAAVRDLHYWYPGQFQTDLRTFCPELCGT